MHHRVLIDHDPGAFLEEGRQGNWKLIIFSDEDPAENYFIHSRHGFAVGADKTIEYRRTLKLAFPIARDEDGDWWIVTNNPQGVLLWVADPGDLSMNFDERQKIASAFLVRRNVYQNARSYSFCIEASKDKKEWSLVDSCGPFGDVEEMIADIYSTLDRHRIRRYSIAGTAKELMPKRVAVA